MTYSDGDVYVGDWLSGERHGQGTETIIWSSDGFPVVSTTYVGTYHHNEKHGLGKVTYNMDPNSDPNDYSDDYSDEEGEWKNGLGPF